MSGKESNSPPPGDVEDTIGNDDVHRLQSGVSVAQHRIQHPSALRKGQKLLIDVKTLSLIPHLLFAHMLLGLERDPSPFSFLY